MSRAQRLKAFSILTVSVAVFVPLLAGCGGGGGTPGTSHDRDLMVTYFSHDGRTDVYRNQALELRFTAPVKPNSVSGRTVRFLSGPSLLTPQDGALIVDGNRIFFDPTRSEEAFERDGLTSIPDRPFGFEPLASYQIFIPGRPTLKTLTNRSGKPIVKSFFGTFQTSELYLPELEPPQFIGIDGTGQLGFIPDLIFDESQGKFVVPFDAQIILQFSEVIAPASMDPGATVLIKNQDILDFLNRPIDIPGTFKPSKDGMTYFFVPSFHYGTGPFRISVSLTQGIKDLAGNPLANPRTLFFETEFNPNVLTISAITESFDTNDFQDPLNTNGGEWNTVKEGELQGGAITTNLVVVNYTPDNINSRTANVDFPLTATASKPACNAWPNGNHTQASYKQIDIGGQGAITEIAWGPDSDALFAATHTNIQIRLGHTKTSEGILGTTFADNFRDGVPQPHYDGQYAIPQAANIGGPQMDEFWPFPKLTTPFDYDGLDGLLIDWQVTSANDCQTLRGWFWGVPATSPGTKNVVATSKSGTVDNFTGGGQPYVYDMQFTKRRRLTTAQSVFYDTAQAQPEYGDPILSPPAQEGGASFVLEFQGADGMPDLVDPSKVIPDPSTETAWSTSVDVADRKRFIRFRLRLEANLNSDTVPRFTQIQIPFQFKP